MRCDRLAGWALIALALAAGPLRGAQSASPAEPRIGRDDPAAGRNGVAHADSRGHRRPLLQRPSDSRPRCLLPPHRLPRRRRQWRPSTRSGVNRRRPPPTPPHRPRRIPRRRWARRCRRVPRPRNRSCRSSPPTRSRTGTRRGSLARPISPRAPGSSSTATAS